jgi:DNA-binding HxlR family transcriptional regulator
VVGDRWALLIIREAFLGTARFESFQARLGVARHRLGARLQKLVDHGILDRVRYQNRPARFEYLLTEKGRDLFPVIVSLLRWGDRWMAGEEGPPVTLVHRSCGHTMVPELSCPECGDVVQARDVQIGSGPLGSTT